MMNGIHSLNQDLKITYFAMMSRIVQSRRQSNIINNMHEIQIQVQTPETSRKVPFAVNIERKSVQEVVTA